MNAGSGAGVASDVGSHVLDMAQFVLGEVSSIEGSVAIVVSERPDGRGGGARLVENPDMWTARLMFRDGAHGVVEASRLSFGRVVEFDFAVEGSKGSAQWSFSRLNEVEVALSTNSKELSGFTRVVLGSVHSEASLFMPAGVLGIGFAESKVAEIAHLLGCIAGHTDPSPSVSDGLRVMELVYGSLGSWS